MGSFGKVRPKVPKFRAGNRDITFCAGEIRDLGSIIDGCMYVRAFLVKDALSLGGGASCAGWLLDSCHLPVGDLRTAPKCLTSASGVE